MCDGRRKRYGTKRAHSRTGSALLFVLLVLMGTVSMAAGIQHLLVRRSRALRMESNDRKLRAALILGLREAVNTLAASEWTVEAFSDPSFQLREFKSSEGVQVRLQIRDAQDRFNLNDLRLPLTPDTPRSPWRMFEDLLRARGVEIKPEALTALRGWIETEEVWFESPDQLKLALGDDAFWSPVRDSLSSLPRPSNRALSLNVNTVRPEVFRAMVGPSLHGWADSVLAAREQEPIRNIAAWLQVLPDVIRPSLDAALDVRSEYVEATLVAETDHTRKTLSALLHRVSGDGVEVIRCRW